MKKNPIICVKAFWYDPLNQYILWTFTTYTCSKGFVLYIFVFFHCRSFLTSKADLLHSCYIASIWNKFLLWSSVACMVTVRLFFLSISSPLTSSRWAKKLYLYFWRSQNMKSLNMDRQTDAGQKESSFEVNNLTCNTLGDLLQQICQTTSAIFERRLRIKAKNIFIYILTQSVLGNIMVPYHWEFLSQ